MVLKVGILNLDFGAFLFFFLKSCNSGKEIVWFCTLLKCFLLVL